MSPIINKTIAFIKKELSHSEGGHDWWHCYRVWKMSKRLAENEHADLNIIELAALLHDIADSKFNNGDETIGHQKADEFMAMLNIPESTRIQVVDIIRHISFKTKTDATDMSIEFKIVQDADRLDAIGAIGIARTFNYGGYKNRSIYNPDIKPNLTITKEEYKKSEAPTLNHFYEKLLLLKDLMNTPKAKQIAEGRHRFMEQFLKQFNKEWQAVDFE